MPAPPDMLQFVYLPIFERVIKGVLSDEACSELEQTLIADPECGDRMAGTGGVRKLRETPCESSQRPSIRKVEGRENKKFGSWTCSPTEVGHMKTMAKKARSTKQPARSRGRPQRAARSTRNIGDEIIEGLKEAVAFERGKMTGVKVVERPLSARQATAAAAPDYKPRQIAEIRSKLNLSQSLFARVFNVSPETAKSWEQGKAPPNGSAKRLLQIADAHPELLRDLVVPK
jgi:putative transcriptional regulator